MLVCTMCVCKTESFELCYLHKLLSGRPICTRSGDAVFSIKNSVLSQQLPADANMCTLYTISRSFSNRHSQGCRLKVQGHGAFSVTPLHKT